jgi:hypothetical protein
MNAVRRWLVLVLLLVLAVAFRPKSASVAVPKPVDRMAATPVPSPTSLRLAAPAGADSTVRVTTPAQGSKQRSALLAAVRLRLKTSSRFKVDHVRVAGRWAFLRATEIVPLDGGEQQETDLSVAALLEQPATSATWRVVEIWTLPGASEHPLESFKRRVHERLRVERLPTALLPDDL